MTTDPLTKAKHRRMVAAAVERQKQRQRQEGLEVVVTMVAQKLRENPLNSEMATLELSSLATLLKREGYGRDDFLDIVHWIEDQVGFKLIPPKGTVTH